MKPNRKPILEEIEFLHHLIKDLQKQIKDLEAWVTWTNTFVKELLDIVGIQTARQSH